MMKKHIVIVEILSTGFNYVEDAITGALLVLLSTPCSAPFLGTAMGFAFTASTPVLFLFFTAAGLGLALPYMLVSDFPKEHPVSEPIRIITLFWKRYGNTILWSLWQAVSLVSNWPPVWALTSDSPVTRGPLLVR